MVGLLVRAEYLPYGVSGLDGLLRGEPFEHEADGFAKQKDVTVLGATFHEVNPVARGRLKLVDARQAPAQLT